MKLSTRVILIPFVFLLVFGWAVPRPAAQGPAPAGPAPAVPSALKLDLTEGSQVRYRVREQLVGINFPSDAVGSTGALTGTLVFGPDGAIDSGRSKLTVDLRTLKSDQELRDGFIQRRVLETEKFPLAEFVPRRAQGMPYPFPTGPGSQAGFQLVGDMTIHGVTREATWTVVATFAEGKVAGRATTSFPFAEFGLTKPSIARLMSVDDTIHLEIEFRSVTSKRS